MKNRIAVIGCGSWGKNYIRNLNDLGVLGAICDSNESRLQKWKERFPYLEIQSDSRSVLKNPEIDAAVISTPSWTHFDLARLALLHDKDVLVEKPLTLSSQECEQLIALAQGRQKILMVGHILHYHPAIVELKKILANEDLGKINYIYSTRLNLGSFRAEENILWSFAPHDISVILGLLKATPEYVSAQGGNYLKKHISDVTVSTMGFSEGTKAHIFVSWLHPFKEQKIVVIGERQMAVFDDVSQDKKLLLYNHTIDWDPNSPLPSKAPAIPVSIENTEPLRAECLHFLECVQARKTPLTDGIEGLKVLRVLEACQKSLESGGKIVFFRKKTSSIFIHETSCIDEDCRIGEGTRIWHFSHVLKNSTIGRDCNIGQNVVIGPNVTVGSNVKIQNNVSVYDGVTLEDDVFCGPSLVFTNVSNPRSHWPRKNNFTKTLVRKGATLGANATIVCGVTVGRYAFVGAGAVVTKDVPDFALVYGIPARLKGWVCACGTRLGFSAGSGRRGSTKCRACGQTYQKKGRIVSEKT